MNALDHLSTDVLRTGPR